MTETWKEQHAAALVRERAAQAEMHRLSPPVTTPLNERVPNENPPTLDQLQAARAELNAATSERERIARERRASGEDDDND